MKKIYIILLGVLVLLSCGEDSTIGGVEFGSIKGKVVKSKSFEPISNAKVTLTPSNNSTFTNENGEYLFEEVPAGEYSVEAEKEGFLNKFEPASLEVGATLSINFEMVISTALNKAPTKPELVAPDDAEENLEKNIELVWRKAIDPDEDPVNYTVELRNDFNNEVLKFENLTDTIHKVDNLKFGGKYFWQVFADDGINSAIASEIRTFKVKTDPENRFVYVRKVNNNNVIYSASIEDDNLVNEVQLTANETNAWRPRKNNVAGLIAFLQINNNQAHIYTMKPNGSDVKQVTSTVPVATFNLNQADFSWSENGEKIIYPHNDKLYVINKDGSGLELIHQTTNGNLITECAWSADGNTIALLTNDSSGYNGFIYTIDNNGAVVDTVISNNVGALGGLDISVDGKRLLYARDVSDFQSANYRRLNNKVFIYNFTDSSTLEISKSKEDGTNDLDPRFSPNEAEVIYMNTSNDGISTKTIYKIEISVNTVTASELIKDAIMPDWE